MKLQPRCNINVRGFRLGKDPILVFSKVRKAWAKAMLQGGRLIGSITARSSDVEMFMSLGNILDSCVETLALYYLRARVNLFREAELRNGSRNLVTLSRTVPPWVPLSPPASDGPRSTIGSG